MKLGAILAKETVEVPLKLHFFLKMKTIFFLILFFFVVLGPIFTKQAVGLFSEVTTVHGVISFGNNCGSGLPGVYTRIASYIDWIESIVWP